MKKIKVLLGALALIASFGLIGCNPSVGPQNNNTTQEAAKETVVATGEKGTFFKWADYSITADNAASYIVRVTYTLDNAEKAGWGPGAFADNSWKGVDSLNEKLNVSAAGVNEVSVTDIIKALPEGFLVNWWADYATLKKVEIIKK